MWKVRERRTERPTRPWLVEPSVLEVTGDRFPAACVRQRGVRHVVVAAGSCAASSDLEGVAVPGRVRRAVEAEAEDPSSDGGCAGSACALAALHDPGERRDDRDPMWELDRVEPNRSLTEPALGCGLRGRFHPVGRLRAGGWNDGKCRHAYGQGDAAKIAELHDAHLRIRTRARGRCRPRSCPARARRTVGCRCCCAR